MRCLLSSDCLGSHRAHRLGPFLSLLPAFCAALHKHSAPSPCIWIDGCVSIYLPMSMYVHAPPFRLRARLLQRRCPFLPLALRRLPAALSRFFFVFRLHGGGRLCLSSPFVCRLPLREATHTWCCRRCSHPLRRNGRSRRACRLPPCVAPVAATVFYFAALRFAAEVAAPAKRILLPLWSTACPCPVSISRLPLPPPSTFAPKGIPLCRPLIIPFQEELHLAHT